MKNEVTDLSNLVPNLSRFSFKAKSELGYWIFGRLEHDYKGQWGLSWGCPKENMNTEMDPYTICQCTGIKDSDGKLIYENDILLVQKPTDGELVYENGTFSVDKPEEETETLTVKYDEDEHCIIVKSDKLKWYWGSRFFRCARVYNWNIKVIGNVFDEENKDGKGKETV